MGKEPRAERASSARRQSVRIAWAGEIFDLLPERAVFWRDRRALLVADPHFGKSDHFRAAGIPVPDTAAATLRRLDEALGATGAEALFFLGDFFHARHGVSPLLVEALRTWRSSRTQVHVVVIAGNHDMYAGPPPECLAMECVGESLDLGLVTLRHHPEPERGRFVIAGHLHPAVRLFHVSGRGMRLPCFHLAPGVFTLPAFGDFTGTHPISAKPGDRVFAVGPGAVVEVTPAALPE